jgi:Nucleotidyl transferase AbiEii toxin, Type IV TA system
MTGAPESPRWRDAEPATFAGTILAAAEQLGVQALAVEKDYWVCEALRAVTRAHPGEIVFKGGTSLEKLRIIRRFSEDLDLLVVGTYESNRATERALKAMIKVAADATGGEVHDGRSGGKPGTFHRSGYITPPLAHSAAPDAIADAKAVLIELGQAGGPKPSSTRTVASLLSRQLAAAGFDVEPWHDLAPFEVSVLHPGRTLIEKLLRVNNFACDPALHESTHGWPRIGRQFYDVWALLGADEVHHLLADAETTSAIVASCFEVSRAFEPDRPIPDGGFAGSPAFEPDGPFTRRLRIEHDAAMRDLYYGTDTPPTFDDVLARVHLHARLLDIRTD